MKIRRIAIVAATLSLIGFDLGSAAQDPPADQQVGIQFDFQDVELGLLLSALADAGNFNLIYSELPARRVTLRMNQPIAQDQVLPLLRSIAASNGLTVVEDGPLLRIETTEPVVVEVEQPGALQAPGSELRLFVYRLKHAKAARLAATLQAMFGGAGMASEFGAPGRLPLSQQLREQRLEPLGPVEPPEVAVELGGQAQRGLPGQLRGELLIVPDEPTNSLLVRAQPADWDVLAQAIEALDLRPLQVLIEVVIAEVRRSYDLQIGITGSIDSSDGNTSGGAQLGGFTAGDFALEVMRTGNTSASALIAMLATSGTVNILSRPVVLAQNNQEARIMVGSERPFIQVSRSLPTDGGVRDQVVQYRDVGTSLTIIPTINDDGYVNLQVIQEVSTATAEEQFGAPIISTREASTQLFVRDGQTVVIGGLMERQEVKIRSGIPILRDIPILGWLFGTTTRSLVESELFIFLTPHIIKTDADADLLLDQVQRTRQLDQDEIPTLRRDTLPRP